MAGPAYLHIHKGWICLYMFLLLGSAVLFKKHYVEKKKKHYVELEWYFM